MASGISSGSGLTFDEFEIDEVFKTPARTVTETDVVSFAGLSHDFNPLHTDETYAAETPFGTRIAHGMLVASIATGLANRTGVFEGTTIALMEQVLRYKGAVMFGDTIHLELTVEEKKETSKDDRGIVRFAADVKKQDGSTVIEGYWTLMMARVAGGSDEQ